jgi:hypothetical protein
VPSAITSSKIQLRKARIRGQRPRYLHALYAAGLTEPFLTLSRVYLEDHDDPVLLRRRITRLQQLGRAGDRVRDADRLTSSGCDGLQGCRAAIALVHALAAVQRLEHARALLRVIRDPARAAGLGDAVETAAREVGEYSGKPGLE